MRNTKESENNVTEDILEFDMFSQSINKYIYLHVNIPTMQHNTRSNALLIAFKFSNDITLFETFFFKRILNDTRIIVFKF